MTDQSFHIVEHDRQLTMTRWFSAPRTLVWRAFADPLLLAQWWGPEGFTCTVNAHDFRVGGSFAITITSPEGQAFPGRWAFDEIVAPERIVYHNVAAAVLAPAWKGNPPALYTNTLTFEEFGARTRLTLLVEFATDKDRMDSVARGFGHGNAQALGKLERLLMSLKT